MSLMLLLHHILILTYHMAGGQHMVSSLRVKQYVVDITEAIHPDVVPAELQNHLLWRVGRVVVEDVGVEVFLVEDVDVVQGMVMV